MYYINKIVGYLISPIGGTIAGGIVAFACVLLKRVRLAKWIGGCTLVLLWLWMTPVLGRFIGAPLEREFLVDGRVPAVESFPEVDAIVVLGGGMGIETNLSDSAEMWLSADRVWQAAKLWRAGRAPKVLATSGLVDKTTFPLLQDFGVPAECLSRVDGARNTEDEAKSISELGLKKIILVTSAWHMKRARLMFKMYAPSVEVVCAPADFELSFRAVAPFSLLELLPDTYSFHLNTCAVHEWIGIAGYKLCR